MIHLKKLFSEKILNIITSINKIATCNHISPITEQIWKAIKYTRRISLKWLYSMDFYTSKILTNQNIIGV